MLIFLTVWIISCILLGLIMSYNINEGMKTLEDIDRKCEHRPTTWDKLWQDDENL